MCPSLPRPETLSEIYKMAKTVEVAETFPKGELVNLSFSISMFVELVASSHKESSFQLPRSKLFRNFALVLFLLASYLDAVIACRAPRGFFEIALMSFLFNIHFNEL